MRVARAMPKGVIKRALPITLIPMLRTFRQCSNIASNPWSLEKFKGLIHFKLILVPRFPLSWDWTIWFIMLRQFILHLHNCCCFHLPSQCYHHLGWQRKTAGLLIGLSAGCFVCLFTCLSCLLFLSSFSSLSSSSLTEENGDWCLLIGLSAVCYCCCCCCCCFCLHFGCYHHLAWQRKTASLLIGLSAAVWIPLTADWRDPRVSPTDWWTRQIHPNECSFFSVQMVIYLQQKIRKCQACAFLAQRCCFTGGFT